MSFIFLGNTKFGYNLLGVLTIPNNLVGKLKTLNEGK